MVCSVCGATPDGFLSCRAALTPATAPVSTGATRLSVLDKPIIVRKRVLKRVKTGAKSNGWHGNLRATMFVSRYDFRSTALTHSVHEYRAQVGALLAAPWHAHTERVRLMLLAGNEGSTGIPQLTLWISAWRAEMAWMPSWRSSTSILAWPSLCSPPTITRPTRLHPLHR